MRPKFYFFMMVNLIVSSYARLVLEVPPLFGACIEKPTTVDYEGLIAEKMAVITRQFENVEQNKHGILTVLKVMTLNEILMRKEISELIHQNKNYQNVVYAVKIRDWIEYIEKHAFPLWLINANHLNLYQKWLAAIRFAPGEFFDKLRKLIGDQGTFHEFASSIHEIYSECSKTLCHKLPGVERPKNPADIQNFCQSISVGSERETMKRLACIIIVGHPINQFKRYTKSTIVMVNKDQKELEVRTHFFIVSNIKKLLPEVKSIVTKILKTNLQPMVEDKRINSYQYYVLPGDIDNTKEGKKSHHHPALILEVECIDDIISEVKKAIPKEFAQNTNIEEFEDYDIENFTTTLAPESMSKSTAESSLESTLEPSVKSET